MKYGVVSGGSKWIGLDLSRLIIFSLEAKGVGHIYDLNKVMYRTGLEE